MTREEAIAQLKMDRDLCNFNPMTGEEEPMNEDCRKSAEALDMAIKALEQQPCEDCISRKLLSDNICEGISCNECSFNEIDDESGCLLQKRLDELPSVQPKPKTEWIPVSERLPNDIR